MQGNLTEQEPGTLVASLQDVSYIPMLISAFSPLLTMVVKVLLLNKY
jgi:hypothetical protein